MLLQYFDFMHQQFPMHARYNATIVMYIANCYVYNYMQALHRGTGSSPQLRGHNNMFVWRRATFLWSDSKTGGGTCPLPSGSFTYVYYIRINNDNNPQHVYKDISFLDHSSAE